MTGENKNSELPCSSERQSWTCKNMKPVNGDMDMHYEHYKCEVCGRTMALDYDEMK